MKRLVIHPNDTTTTFLRPVYSDAGVVTLIAGNVEDRQIRDNIAAADQVIMLGHGSPYGLLSVGQFPGPHGTVIRDAHAGQLQRLDNNVYVWCHADEFVKYNDLSGFYTGMFISEMSEAIMMGVRDPAPWMIETSNNEFARALGSCIGRGLSPEETYDFIKQTYGVCYSTNPIVRYNMDRMGWQVITPEEYQPHQQEN